MLVERGLLVGVALMRLLQADLTEVPAPLEVNALMEGGLLPIELLMLGVLLEVGGRQPGACPRPRWRPQPRPLGRPAGQPRHPASAPRRNRAPPGTPPSQGTARGLGEHPPPRLRPLPHHHPRRPPPPPRLPRRHQNAGPRVPRQPNFPRHPPRPQPQPGRARGVRRQLSRASRWRSSLVASRPPASQPRSRLSPPLASRQRCGKR